LLFDTCLILFVKSHDCNAQTVNTVDATAQAQAITFTGKSRINDFDGHLFAAINPGAIDVKASRDFIISFKNAENVHWYKVQGGAVAYYTENNIKARVWYDAKGMKLQKAGRQRFW
jgi:hypothetical protein